VNIGYVSFRLAGTDGVSLETAKIAQVFGRMGHSNYYFAGELDPPDADRGLLDVPIAGSMLVEEAHFTHPDIVEITTSAFSTGSDEAKLRQRIEVLAAHLGAALMRFIKQYNIGMLMPQNIFAIPLNIPLSVAMHRLAATSGLPTLAHHHDFFWERERYATMRLPDILEETFPPDLPNIRHLVINSKAGRDLASRRGIQSVLLPNIFDYATPAPGPDEYNADLRQELGLQPGDLLFLQPTRVIRRKGIELAIELAHRLGDLPIKLVITHHAEHDTFDYLTELLALAARLNVDVCYVPLRFEPQRKPGSGIEKIYSLWDAYIYADFVTYPSLYEGFGNALLETLYFRRPLLVNRYPVYIDDLEPTGLRAVLIDGEVTDSAVQQVRALLADADLRSQMTEHNAQVAQAHFSFEAAQSILSNVIETF